MEGEQLIRIAARSIARAPGFAVTATLAFALGVGLSIAVFTVADALLLRRLPVTAQDRLVALWGETRDGRFTNFPLSLADAREFTRRSNSLERVAFFAYEGATLQTTVRAADRDFALHRALVSGNFFDVLGSRPILGRALHADDDVAGAAPVTVLSHRAWVQRFGGDSLVIGRTLAMAETGRSLRIVGVMPQGLDYPRGTDFWAPLVATSTGTGDSLHLSFPSLDLIARLSAPATAEDARAELGSFFARPEMPASVRDVRAVAYSFESLALGDAKPALLVVLAAAGLLLLVTCVNVANLLLVRSTSRVRELVVRSALGASRARIVGQLLTESALLSALGGALGVAFAVAAVRGFVALAPASVPRLDEIRVNGTVIAAAVLVTAVAMLLSSLAPTLFISRVEAQDALRSGSRHTGGRRLRLATESLVVIQVALAAIVLSATGMIVRSLVKLQRIDLAFETSQLYVGELTLRHDQFPDVKRQVALLDALVPRLQSLPGVRAVSPVLYAPFAGTGAGISGRLGTAEQTPEQVAAGPMLNLEVVTPTYFSTLGVSLRGGRVFNETDVSGATPVIVIGESTARHFWPNGDAIGKRLGMPGSAFTVVGVVADTRYRELRSARPTVYFPLRQSFFPVVPTTLLIRSSVAPAQLLPMLQRAVADASPGVTLSSAQPFDAFLEEPRAQPRLNAMLLAIFAVASVSLAAIGLFAVIATMVRQRTREIGIRMALGATESDVGRMVLTRGLIIASLGAMLGIAGALSTGRWLSGLLFEVRPTDPATLGGVGLLLVAVAVLACLVPARASGRIEPVIALRSEG